MDFTQSIGIHNVFNIEITDKDTGIVKASGEAHNIVLDQMYNRVCNFQPFFINISFGNGTGTPVPSRVSLFNGLGTKQADVVEVHKDLKNNLYYVKKKIVLDNFSYNGAQISEVGVAFDANATSLVTHALTTDELGNPKTFSKTDQDIMVIYSTVYFRLGDFNDNFKMTNLPDNNMLLNYFLNGTSPSWKIQFGGGRSYVGNDGVSCVRKYLDKPITFTPDIANKKVNMNTVLVDNNEVAKNIWEIGFDSFARAVLPCTGVYPGTDVYDVVLGTGDGVTTKFAIPVTQIDDTIVVKKNGVPTTAFTTEDYLDELSYSLYLDNVPGLAQNELQDIEFTSDGQYIFMGFSYAPYFKLFKFDSSNNTLGAEVPLPVDILQGASRGISISPDDKYIAITGSAGTGNEQMSVYAFDNINGIVGRKLTNPTGIVSSSSKNVRFSRNGNFLMFNYGYTIQIYAFDGVNGVIGAKISSYTLSGALVNDMKVSRNDDYIAVSQAGDNGFRLFPFNNQTGLLGTPFTLTTGSTKSINSVSFSLNDKYIAVGYSEAPYVGIYPLIKTNNTFGSPLALPIDIPQSGVNKIRFSHDGEIIAISTNISPYYAVYKFADGFDIRYTNVENYSVAVKGIGFSPDNSYMALGLPLTASSQKVLRVFDITKNRTRVIFNTAPVNGDRLTCDFKVNYIPKTTDNQIQISGFSIQFGTFV